MKSFIKRGKDKLDFLSNQNVVYKISCDDCEASYVGQTKRKLSTRLYKHISDIRKNIGSATFITDHRINFDYYFKWNEVKILGCESLYNKRLVSVMIHIRRQKQGLNKQNDTEFLPETYRSFNVFLLLNYILFLFISSLPTFSSLYIIFSLLCSPSFLVYHFNLLVFICVLYYVSEHLRHMTFNLIALPDR